MKIFLTILIGTLSLNALAESYIEKRIEVAEDNEMYVSDGYDLFLKILTGKAIDSSDVQLPKSMLKDGGDTYSFDWAYYISPNEQKGFILIFPKSIFREKDGIMEPTCKVVLDKYDAKQGISMLTVKEYDPNQRVDLTRPQAQRR